MARDLQLIPVERQQIIIYIFLYLVSNQMHRHTLPSDGTRSVFILAEKQSCSVQFKSWWLQNESWTCEQDSRSKCSSRGTDRDQSLSAFVWIFVFWSLDFDTQTYAGPAYWCVVQYSVKQSGGLSGVHPATLGPSLLLSVCFKCLPETRCFYKPLPLEMHIKYDY